MPPELDQIEIDRYESAGFNDSDEPTSLTIAIRNKNEYKPDNSNTVAVTYSPIVDYEYRTEDGITLTVNGETNDRATISWPSSVYDSNPFDVGVAIQTMSIFDGSSYNTVTDIDKYKQLSLPLRLNPPGDQFSLDACNVSTNTVPIGGEFQQTVTLNNIANTSPVFAVRVGLEGSGYGRVYYRTPTVDQFSTQNKTMSFSIPDDAPTGEELSVSAELSWVEFASFPP